MEAGCIIADINQRNFLNQRDIRKSRQHAFETHDKPRMKSLPAGHFTVCDYKYSLRVLDNYHLEYDGHYYSVMYTKHGKPVLLKATMSEISICDENNKLLCTHVRSYKDFLRCITEDAHMPPEHRYYKELNAHDGAYYRRWATVYGDATLASVRGHLIHLPSKPEESRRKSGQIRRKQDGLFRAFILFSTAFHLVPDFPVPQIVKIKFIEILFIEIDSTFCAGITAFCRIAEYFIRETPFSHPQSSFKVGTYFACYIQQRPGDPTQRILSYFASGSRSLRFHLHGVKPASQAAPESFPPAWPPVEKNRK